jgi:thiosulfate/3-mercaptopyruvate sulfurtransferase
MSTCLISAAELLGELNSPDQILLDCRHDLLNPEAGRAAYLAGHLPGARFASIDTDLAGAKTGPDGVFRGRHPLPEPEALIATLRRFGIGPHSRVVAYDAHGGMYAARAWWLLRWIGHTRVWVLDGGLAAWQAASGALETGAETPRAGGSIERKPALAGTVTVNEVQDNIHNGSKIVLDARAPDRFRGENETIDPVGGHIPGARNRFFKDNLQANGQFKSAAELQAEFAPLLGDPKQAIMQCGSGVTACHNLLALEVAGMSGAQLYPGSWSEWCADPSRPIATGS